MFNRLLNVFSAAQPTVTATDAASLKPSILLYNTVAGRSYDVQFISSFSPKPITKERYASDNVRLTVDVPLNEVAFQTRMKVPKDPYGRMPVERTFRDDFAGINVVICFLTGANATEFKLSSVLNKIRASMKVPKAAVGFVLIDPCSSQKLVETFCAANQVEFFTIDEFNPSQVVPVVQKLLSNLANQIGVSQIDQFNGLYDYHAARFAKLLRAPKNQVLAPPAPIKKLEEELNLTYPEPIVLAAQNDNAASLSAA